MREGISCPAEAFVPRVLGAFGEFLSFFVYLSFGSEVGTGPLIHSLLEAGKRVCVPRLERGEMRSVPLTDKLVREPHGFLQPDEGEEQTCEVAITPLLAVDAEGFRLGYGGGYYDRYFAAHPQVLRVGLGFEAQLSARLPRGMGDIPLHALVTEREVRFFGQALDSGAFHRL